MIMNGESPGNESVLTVVGGSRRDCSQLKLIYG
jgi:hypothetical protein